MVLFFSIANLNLELLQGETLLVSSLLQKCEFHLSIFIWF